MHDFLYVNPSTSKISGPILDELTRKLTACWRLSTQTGPKYRGFHICPCGARSTNTNYQLPNGDITNSLCIHYVACHRNELSKATLDKVSGFTWGAVEPTDQEVLGR